MHANIRHKLKKAVSTPDYLKIFVLRFVGNFLILLSLFLIGKTFYQPVREELRFFVDNSIQKKYVISDVQNPQKTTETVNTGQDKGLLARALNLNSVEVLTPVDTNFGIIIPKIAANAKVLSDINPVDETVYLKALKQGVAHARGTAYPGQGNHIFLFAHSTDYFWNVGTYNAVFYLLYKLEKGDEIDLFYQGKRYKYQVITSKIVDPNEVEYLTRETNREFLTLQTCWPLGTALKRLLIFAERSVE